MDTHSTSYDLFNLLDQIKNAGKADNDQIKYLLSLSHPRDVDQLFRAARHVREKKFGNTVFLYGFLYFSTFCRNDCRFCRYRASNHTLPRYRKTEPQILAAAEEMAATGVHLIDMTMGEDPAFLPSGEKGGQYLADLCAKVHKTSGLPVMVSPGVIRDDMLKKMAQSGVSWYACYQETHTPELYDRLRSDQDFQERMTAKEAAKKQGMLIEEGILTGVGETVDDLCVSMQKMAQLDADQVRVMTFVPQKGTPMENFACADSLNERIIIAVMRLLFPDRLIPASLDVDGLDGLKHRLDAGANVITSIVPPDKELAGVANLDLDIENSRRTIGAITPVLKSCNLSVGTQASYSDWVRQRGINFHNNVPVKNNDPSEHVDKNSASKYS